MVDKFSIFNNILNQVTLSLYIGREHFHVCLSQFCGQEKQVSKCHSKQHKFLSFPPNHKIVNVHAFILQTNTRAVPVQ